MQLLVHACSGAAGVRSADRVPPYSGGRPFPQIGVVTVDAKDGGQLVAHAEFDGLAPGGGAMPALSPRTVRCTRDEIVVVPTSGLPTGEATFADFYPLDDTTVSAKLYSLERLRDRRTVFTCWSRRSSGRAAVTFGGMPYVPLPSYSCPGFDICTANADNTLGPGVCDGGAVRRRARWPLRACLTVLGGAGCSGRHNRQVMLLARAVWNEDPSMVAETGYQVSADVGWPDRVHSCFPLSPNLASASTTAKVTPMVDGDCQVPMGPA